MLDTSTWHLPHGGYGKRCHCPGPHLRVDEVHHDPEPEPAHPLAWPTRPLVDTDPMAAAHLPRDGGEAFYCYGCARRRGTHRGSWRVVTHAEREQLPVGGCAGCANPWPRSAFAGAAYFRSSGNSRDAFTGAGLLCPPCAATGPDGRWFAPSGLRRSPTGPAWYRLLSASDPIIALGLACIGCGQRVGGGDRPPFIGSPTAPNERRDPMGNRQPARLPALSGNIAPYPYVSDPADLRRAFALVDRTPVDRCGCRFEPAHSPALHELVTAMLTFKGLRSFGQPFRAWFVQARASSHPALWRVPGDIAGPYACAACAVEGTVPGAQPLTLEDLLADPAAPPACGVACHGCARPVIPERWHEVTPAPWGHDPSNCPAAAQGRCHTCNACTGPHLGRDETLRPPGYLAGTTGARPTRALSDDEEIGGAIQYRPGFEEVLCPPCYARARRSSHPHYPLYAKERAYLPETGCDRCHRPWALSALVTGPAAERQPDADPDAPGAELVELAAETFGDPRLSETLELDDADLPGQLRRIADRVAEVIARAEAAKDDFTLRRGWGVRATGAERGWAHVEMALVGADYDVASHTRAEAAGFLVYDIAADLWELCDELGLDVFREIVRSLEQREERR